MIANILSWTFYWFAVFICIFWVRDAIKGVRVITISEMLLVITLFLGSIAASML